MRLGIVVSETYWELLTSKMLDLALKTAKENKVETEVLKVPGSFDIPYGTQILLEKEKIDGVVTLGAVVQGKTDHDGVISYAVANKLLDLQQKYEKPVVLGINGPKMNREQAIERIPRAAEVTKACIQMINATSNK
ncbi:6,7-dimethyl-8-ribityllumazine synthase [Candidatus Woesearchaeota archaeon CG10_big_fil_rev_8_21_14_0_10_45_16]|nr:MAG: 6,7-dimethyl-8-ribityllumazine synthase [Candidatus Woesearchaeota archaeon CG10_big_fil_rev_8_21_14_0_10_45_16]